MKYSAETIVEALTVVCICVISILGNGSLFIIVYKKSALHTVCNYYILSLATADLLVSTISGPVMVTTILNGDWMLSDDACKVLGFITIITFIASVANLAMIAINRYYYIVHWKSYKNCFNNKRAVAYGAIVWLFAILLSTPPLLGWGQYGYVKEQSFCFVIWSANIYYMFFTVIICFFGPLGTMVFCYYKILSFTKALKARLHKDSEKNDDESRPKSSFKNSMRGISPAETKITNTLLLVVVCFVMSWSAFAFTIFLNVYLPGKVPRGINKWSLILGYLNSMMNPAIYGIRNPTFKDGFSELWKCFLCVPCRGDGIYVTSAATTSSVDDSHAIRDIGKPPLFSKAKVTPK
ncbi:melatonin receptor type 1B [Nematostella vectensis]|nr:melatonin receptor type 1B [Nematostella vectensis]XP_032221157.2 melatonin receptor type 1B [Nematostella vectensis]XP_032221159.2 melatonin receptor type 1B [Nematostella vectensis]XP_048576017.1 melatonin receptor type 1B [Nematostella vectensis]XP_048576018.1 melatonin receptor type 1B [Nematostella vectensis]